MKTQFVIFFFLLVFSCSMNGQKMFEWNLNVMHYDFLKEPYALESTEEWTNWNLSGLGGSNIGFSHRFVKSFFLRYQFGFKYFSMNYLKYNDNLLEKSFDSFGFYFPLSASIRKYLFQESNGLFIEMGVIGFPHQRIKGGIIDYSISPFRQGIADFDKQFNTLPFRTNLDIGYNLPIYNGKKYRFDIELAFQGILNIIGMYKDHDISRKLYNGAYIGARFGLNQKDTN